MVHTEMDCFEEGIVELISQHEIRKLVMGAAAEKQCKKNKLHWNFPFFFSCSILVLCVFTVGI